MRYLVVAIAAAIVLAAPAPAAAPGRSWTPAGGTPVSQGFGDVRKVDVLDTAEHLLVEATGYSYDDGNGDGVTATGTVPRPGVCAVDPGVIPLGTKLWVPGYGWARAEDTGGAIRGAKIDLFFPTREAALQWGRRTVQVKVVTDSASGIPLEGNQLGAQ